MALFTPVHVMNIFSSMHALGGELIDPSIKIFLNDTHTGSKAPDYLALKQRWQDACVAKLLELYPKVRGKIDYFEVSTPATIEHYLRTQNGGAVGLDQTPARFTVCLSLSLFLFFFFFPLVPLLISLLAIFFVFSPLPSSPLHRIRWCKSCWTRKRAFRVSGKRVKVL
jgi:hypothetical protein